MKFGDLEKSALQLNELYEQLEIKKWGRVWTTAELALGFVGDVGDLAKLVQANAGVRDIDDCKAKLGHELSDCLWSIIVLANKCGIDLEAEFVRNTQELAKHVSGQLFVPAAISGVRAGSLEISSLKGPLPTRSGHILGIVVVGHI